MNATAEAGKIWVWTDKAEQKAKARGLESRPAGVPAWCGFDLLGRYAPLEWVKSGYLEQANEKQAGVITMLADVPNNKFALEVLRIISGKLKVDRGTAEMCYVDNARRDHAELSRAIAEMNEKLTDEQKKDEFFIGCYADFREKISIYERLFRWFEEIPAHV